MVSFIGLGHFGPFLYFKCIIKVFRGNLVILGLKTCVLRVILAFLGVEATFNQFVIRIILIVSKSVYESSI